MDSETPSSGVRRRLTFLQNSNPVDVPSDDALEPFPAFDFSFQRADKTTKPPRPTDEVFYDAPSVPPIDTASPPPHDTISPSPPPTPVPAKAKQAKGPPSPPKRRRSAEFSHPTDKDQTLFRTPPLPPRHQVPLDNEDAAAATTISPIVLAPGVPRPVYSFLWPAPSHSSAGAGGIYPVLEFVRASDAIAFELASSPFTAWGGSGRSEVRGLSDRQVRVLCMPRHLRSVHPSPLQGHSMRWCFAAPDGADELNEWLCCVGTKSMWCVEGWSAMYCVDI